MTSIVQLVDSSGIGGIERHIATLTRALTDNGFEAEIWLYGAHGANAWLDQLNAEHLKFRILGGSFKSLSAALQDTRPALVHTHGYKAGIVGRLAAKLRKVPVVSTFHAGERAPFPVSLYQTLDQWSAFGTKTIAVSKPIAQALPFGAAHVPNFVAAAPSPPVMPLPDSVAFVGRLSFEKGPDLFGELAKSLQGQSRFHIYGDGPMRAELEAKYGAYVTFHGMVTDMATVWPKVGLLLITSRAEGLPMAALEAMAAGVPVIAPRLGALPDVIREGQNGWLFPPQNLDLAKQAVQHWCKRRLSSELRRDCWRTIQNHFSVEQGVTRILAVYREAGFKPDLPAPDMSNHQQAAAPEPVRRRG